MNGQILKLIVFFQNIICFRSCVAGFQTYHMFYVSCIAYANTENAFHKCHIITITDFFTRSTAEKE